MPQTPWQPSSWRSDPGLLAPLAIGFALTGFALSLNFPQASQGYKGDEATYYSLAHSLARDLDVEYRREDLVCVWEEYSGPQGIFLKRGRAIEGIRPVGRFPFLEIEKGKDPDPNRLYYGKAFIYPLFAAPFVRWFGTNGFLVLHAWLMALNVAAAFALLVARGTPRGVAITAVLVFFGASVVPVYLVWLSPEFFNVSLVMYVAFLWAYKEARPGARSRRDGASDFFCRRRRISRRRRSSAWRRSRSRRTLRWCCRSSRSPRCAPPLAL